MRSEKEAGPLHMGLIDKKEFVFLLLEGSRMKQRNPLLGYCGHPGERHRLPGRFITHSILGVPLRAHIIDSA